MADGCSATHLVALGLEGDDLVAPASLAAPVSGWDVDALVPGALDGIGAPNLTTEEAGDIFARLMVQVSAFSSVGMIRVLASLAPDLDYPGGLFGRCYGMADYLDCECQPDMRGELDAFEAQLPGLPALEISPALAEALVTGF